MKEDIIMQYGYLIDKKTLTTYLKWYLSNPLKNKVRQLDMSNKDNYTYANQILQNTENSSNTLFPNPLETNLYQHHSWLNGNGVFKDNREKHHYINKLKQQKLVGKKAINNFCVEITKYLNATNAKKKVAGMKKIKSLHKLIVKSINHKYAKKYQKLMDAFHNQDKPIRNKLYRLNKKHDTIIHEFRMHKINWLKKMKRLRLTDSSLDTLLSLTKDSYKLHRNDNPDIKTFKNHTGVVVKQGQYHISDSNQLIYIDYFSGKKMHLKHVSAYTLIDLIYYSLLSLPKVYQKNFVTNDICFDSDLKKLETKIKANKIETLKNITVSDPLQVLDYQNFVMKQK